MILTANPNFKLPCIRSYSQPMTLVYKKLGSIVDDDHCNHHYHDLLERANPEKWNSAVKIAAEQFPDLGHERTANFFQAVLCEYFEIPIEITGIYTGINQSNCYQYWVFATSRKSKTLEIEPNLRKIEPISRYPELDDSPNVFGIFIGILLFVLVGFWIFNFLELAPATTKIYNDLNQELNQQNNRVNPSREP
jgi:hypothetical protein